MCDTYERILKMTNKEAANILKPLLKFSVPRANGKSMTDFAKRVALMKAIKLLDTTPDEKNKPDFTNHTGDDYEQ